EAAQARERLPPGAESEPETGHFGKAAADQRRSRALAEAPALEHAPGDRQHILDRAADLRAGEVVRNVDAKGRLLHPVAKPFGEGCVLRGERDSSRQALGDLMSEGRA